MNTIEVMTDCWERVLRRKPIRPCEDFFALGGDSILAAQLMGEIENKLGLSFPLTAICGAPTIESLASLSPQSAIESPLIPLHSGNGLPVFVTHGIGSSVVDLVPLVRGIRVTQPIYGLEARGNSGRQEPFDRIEDMAEYFLTTVRKVQPDGPCLLVGYSLGGLVALEMARGLLADGRQIGLLTMLDSYPDRRALSLSQHAKLAIRLGMQRVSRSLQSTKRELPGDLLDMDTSKVLSESMQRTKVAHYRALRAYRPSPYDGAVRFVKASVPTHFPSDPIPIWSPFMRDLRVESVAGDHHDLLRAKAAILGEMLTGYIREST